MSRSDFEPVQPNPVALTAYLRSRGWRESGGQAGRFSLWSLATDRGEAEALAPADPTLVDYPVRIRELLATLVAVEGRAAVEISEDIGAAVADTVRFRFLGPEFDDHTVALDAGSRMLAATREILEAAACTVVEPKAAYYARRPTEVGDYLGSVRLLPPKRGSFVLTMRSPVPPAVPRQGELFDDAADPESPFGRRALLQLRTALGTLRDSLAELSSRGDALLDKAAQGLSANLLDAVGEMLESRGMRELEITVSAATMRPGLPPASFTFPSTFAATLRESARVLRETTPESNFVLEGVVTALKHEGGQTGTVTIEAAVRGALRKVRCTLEGDAHKLAVKAYDTRGRIACAGTLTKSGAMLSLTTPTGFRLVEESP